MHSAAVHKREEKRRGEKRREDTSGGENDEVHCDIPIPVPVPSFLTCPDTLGICRQIIRAYTWKTKINNYLRRSIICI
jgi:hypothetical protein